MTVGDYRWEPCWGTPLTYAARVSRLRAVAGIHSLAARGNYPNDIALWKATQGVGGRQLIHLYCRESKLTDLEGLAFGIIELVTRRSRKQDLLMFPTPTLATHVHEPFMAEGRDWERVATAGLAELT